MYIVNKSKSSEPFTNITGTFFCYLMLFPTCYYGLYTPLITYYLTYYPIYNPTIKCYL